MMSNVGILGAGAMGAGIAQVAAVAGWNVRLFDIDGAVAQAACASIAARLHKRVERGRMSADDAQEASARIQVADEPSHLSQCSLLLEAIVEDMDIKVRALSVLLDHFQDDAVVATNTSSLSVTDLGKRLQCGHRVCGMHFFNPAPAMKLVEVVAGQETDTCVVDTVASIAKAWGKTVAHCADTPGFIVNRVARPYYLEAFRCLEDGLGGPDSIDAAMCKAAGFRMGPFALTDLIGHDVNTATTRSVWSSWNEPARLMPVHAQESLVASGDLGRKTGCGVYSYAGESPVAVIGPSQQALTLTRSLTEAAANIAAKVSPAAEQLPPPLQVAMMRVLCGLFNEAMWAKADGVAEAHAIDTAMLFGVNYPKGPFQWMVDLGEPVVDAAFEALCADVSEDRFARPAAGV
jgi:3-hydroxybutyryl-CoA dehydrogenase